MHCAARSASLEAVRTRLERREWEAAKSAPKPPPRILRALLSEDDVQQLEAYAWHVRCSREGGAAGWVRYGEAHQATFLHYVDRPEGELVAGKVAKAEAEAEIEVADDEEAGSASMAFPQACPGLFRRICARVREAADGGGMCEASAFDLLSVRCVEHHTYTAGGGLTEKGHLDAGSCLTLSVLLSEGGCNGGVFTTTDSEGATVHKAALTRS